MAEDVAMAGQRGELAAAAAREARAVGASGPGNHGQLTPVQRQLRDWAIVAALEAGEKRTDVAREFDVSPRQVTRIAKGFNGSRTPLEDPPMEIVTRMVRTYLSQIRRFALMAAAHEERTPAVAIAAMKGEAEAHERLVTLLSDVGKLPSNLETFRGEDEIRRIAAMMGEKVAALERGELSVTELADWFYGLGGVRVETVDGEPVGELESGEVVQDG